MMKNDIYNYDFLSVRLKKSNALEITEYYEKFLWEQIEQIDDKLYEDIVHVSFKRNHHIPNKDEVQFLQVDLENEINQIAKMKKNTHNRSTVFGISFGISSTLFMGVGILLALYFNNFYVIILGIFVALINATFLVLLGLKLKKIYQQETERYSIEHNESVKRIASIIGKLEDLIGSKKYEQSD